MVEGQLIEDTRKNKFILFGSSGTGVANITSILQIFPITRQTQKSEDCLWKVSKNDVFLRE